MASCNIIEVHFLKVWAVLEFWVFCNNIQRTENHVCSNTEILNTKWELAESSLEWFEILFVRMT